METLPGASVVAKWLVLIFVLKSVQFCSDSEICRARVLLVASNVSKGSNV